VDPAARPPSQPLPVAPPAHAFTQGVGTVYQFVGVSLFLASMTACCGSSLLPNTITLRPDLTRIGWHWPGSSDAAAGPFYSGERAITLTVLAGVVFGMTIAGLGLGMQSLRRGAATAAVIVAALGTAFWTVQAVFSLQILHSLLLAAITGALAVLCGALSFLSVGAARQMAHTPPPLDDALSPGGPAVPGAAPESPDAALAREVAQRRQRLAVEQAEVEYLERRLARRLKEKDR